MQPLRPPSFLSVCLFSCRQIYLFIQKMQKNAKKCKKMRANLHISKIYSTFALEIGSPPLRVCRFFNMLTTYRGRPPRFRKTRSRQSPNFWERVFSFPGAKLLLFFYMCKLYAQKNAFLCVFFRFNVCAYMRICVQVLRAAALPVCFASIRTNVLFLRIYALIFGKCKVLRSFVRKNLHISKICCTFALEIENN